MQSCMDDDYDFDDMDKNANFLIPPVPIGDIDVFKIDELDFGVIPPGIEIPPTGLPIEVEEVYEQTVESLFTEDILDKFFYKDAKGDVVLESKVDIDIMDNNPDVTIDIVIQIIDDNGRAMTEVKIPKPARLKCGENQSLNIVFPNEYFDEMQTAKDLKFIIVLKSKTINISSEDYIYIKEIVLKSSGLHFEF